MRIADRVEITGDEAGVVKAMPQLRGRGTTSSFSAALKDGKVMWFPGGDVRHFGTYRTSLKRQGYAVRTRTGSRDGVAGCYVWAAPIEVTK